MRQIRAGGREAGVAASAMGGSAMNRVGTYRIAYILADVSAQPTAEHLLR